MPTKERDIIVIGTSAGGLEALDQLIGQLPTDLPASIVIVQHMDPGNSGEPLLRRLSRHQAFHPKLARNGERLKLRQVYIALPDHHLVIKNGKLLVTKGAAENCQRPAIDPLFRSAAVSHGSRVIGVLLTGMMDDGTVGFIALKRCGGVTVVQDPKDGEGCGDPSTQGRASSAGHTDAGLYRSHSRAVIGPEIRHSRRQVDARQSAQC